MNKRYFLAKNSKIILTYVDVGMRAELQVQGKRMQENAIH